MHASVILLQIWKDLVESFSNLVLILKKTEKWLRKKIIKFTAVLHGKNPVRANAQIVRLPN